MKIYINRIIILSALITSSLFASQGVPTINHDNYSSQNKKGSEYEKASLSVIEKFLKTKDSIQKSDRKVEESTYMEKSIKKKVKYKSDELDIVMLPIPKKSLIINDKIIVFAEYREKILSSDTKPNKDNSEDLYTSMKGDDWKTDPLVLEAMAQEKYPQYSGISSNSIEYDSKLIKIRIGDRFGNYIVKTASSSVIVYQHVKDKNKYIKKFY